MKIKIRLKLPTPRKQADFLMKIYPGIPSAAEYRCYGHIQESDSIEMVEYWKSVISEIRNRSTKNSNSKPVITTTI